MEDLFKTLGEIVKPTEQQDLTKVPIEPQQQALNIPVVRHLVCMNLKRTCSALDAGKCKMVRAKCVFQQTCA